MMHLRSRRRSRVVLSIAVGVVVALSSSGAASSSGPGGGLGEISVLSNRADLISGGDALVSVDLIANARAVRVKLNGADITSSFAVRANGKFEGLVTGLVEGNNVLQVRPANGAGRTITIKNHPIGGPVFSGPQVQPWLCRTQNQTNPTLGPSTDAQCNAPTRVELLLPQPQQRVRCVRPGEPAGAGAHPADDDRRRQDRSVHRRARHRYGQPRHLPVRAARRSDASRSSPWTEQPWNHKYVNTFGGACSVNYQQPTVGNQVSAGTWRCSAAASRSGTSSLNTYGNQCNDIISAEALMMTKEILTERHGPIRYTIGNGGSAGTMQQHLIAEAYPGLLDGITTQLLYEDHWYQVRRLVRLHPALAVLRAAEAAPPLLGSTSGLLALATRCSRRRPIVKRCGAPTRPSRTPCAGRRSASRSPSSSPTTRSDAPAPPSRHCGAGMPSTTRPAHAARSRTTRRASSGSVRTARRRRRSTTSACSTG